MKYKPEKFMDTIFDLKQKRKVNFKATGYIPDTVVKVVPKDSSDIRTDRKIKKLIAGLSAIAFTGAIIKFIQNARGGQLIGINGATHGSGLYLLGHCLEANKPIPKKDEEMQEVELDSLFVRNTKPLID